jgi:hypothetical protein
MGITLIDKTKRYFELFTSRNVKGLENEVYSESVELRDWNGYWIGKQAVLQTNEDFFNNEFSIEIEDIRECIDARSTICMFNLKIIDTEYKVIDVIDWDADSKIKKILAYNG